MTDGNQCDLIDDGSDAVRTRGKIFIAAVICDEASSQKTALSAMPRGYRMGQGARTREHASPIPIAWAIYTKITQK
jgi:hypothetical protein